MRGADCPAAERRDGAQFHEAEAESRPDGDAVGVFVEARGETDGIGEGKAEKFRFQRGEIAAREGLDQRGERRVGHGCERGVMDRLGREGK